MAEMGSDETRRWLEGIDKKLAEISHKVENLDFVRSDTWDVEKLLIAAHIDGNRQLAEASIAEIKIDLNRTQALLRGVGFALFGVIVSVVAGAIFYGLPH